MNDLALMASIGVVLVLLTSLFWIWYNGEMLYQVNRNHAEQVMALNDEMAHMREMVSDTEMQARVMGSVPVSRLIGYEQNE